MLQRLHRRLGTAGMVVAVVALIAALSGTALAASGALTGKQKKEVEKIAKKYAGKPGAPGAPGSNGTNGASGKDGSNGAPGASGKDGESVTLAAASGCGTPGGTKVSVGATSKEVCNGKPGDAGTPGESPIGTPFSGESEPAGNPCDGAGGVNYIVEGAESPVCNGSPWTVGGTLPPGATETGSWAFNGGVETFTVEVAGEEEEITVGDTNGIRVPISFPIPLPQVTVKAAHVHFGQAGSGGAFAAGGACPSPLELQQPSGASGAWKPEAAPGELCIYESEEEGLVNANFVKSYKYSEGLAGATSSGGVLLFEPTGEASLGGGSFAITACAPNAELNECAGP